MSFPGLRKAVSMKSLYWSVLVAMVTTLSLSFVGFHAIADRMQKSAIDPQYDRFDELQLQSARGSFQSGGPQALKSYLTSLDRLFGSSTHYLLDSKGIDLVSGANRAALLPPPPATIWRIHARDHWILSHRSKDGLYWFAAVGPLDRPHIWTFLPYYFLVIGATGILCWLASVGVVSPIRRIAASIALFGQGDLSVRVPTERQDEIGQLGRSFNQMAERLQRLIVSERRLLGDISHEIRSPLARLKFAVKLARTSPDSRAALDRIERDVDRITSLVADILEITSLEGDPALQDTEVLRAAEIVDEVIHDCSLEAEVRDCRIALHGALGGEVLGNRELLRRAIENVLRNGIRYAPQHSNIDVSVAEEEGAANITVRDYGPGVPEETLARLFDPFFRVEEARDTSSGGSGLGLSIAKRAVQAHHGTIFAENSSPGLRVRISIPLVTQPLARLIAKATAVTALKNS
jgi:signal transduction histidine kinase